jgi:hypothetical protein
MDEIGRIKDHQSRIVEASSWDYYCKAFKEYNGSTIEFKALTSMTGSTIPKDADIYNLEVDDYHLSCNMWDGKHGIKKLAYIWD